MSTKETILKVLEENRDRYISGEELAKSLGLSRTSIWKGVNSLKEDGFLIKSSTNKGYKLEETSDKISKYGIITNLHEDLKNIDINYYDTIDSTNTQAKRLLYNQEVNNFTLIVSDEQTSGRGRRGRDFASPKETGIYMSIVLFPKKDFDLNSFDLITIRAAVAVVKAIINKTDKKPEIKWVNDIFLNHKKICGILSEADSDFETRSIKSIIVGIGLNFSTNISDFSEDLRPIVGSLFAENLLRNELIAEITNEFYKAVYHTSNSEIIELYKKYSLLLGRRVTFEMNSIKYEATAIDVNEKGNLVVKLEDNTNMILSSGEVSVKGEF